MKIVIVGGGAVGSAICTQLARENHDITVIDESASALAELANSCDVFSIVGNGADISVLQKANAEKADLLIAVSAMDEINILCCAAARKLGTKHTVARVRNPEYSELMRVLQSEMNLSFTINPELSAANDIYRLLRFPSATKINTFCRGKVELAELVIEEDSPFCGCTLFDLRHKLNFKFLVCGVLRDGRAYIPSGDFTLHAGDIIAMTARDKEITQLFKAMRVYVNPVKNVVIVGGGRVTYYLLSLLEKSKIDATVIEKDPELCQELAAAFSCTVICDNGTQQETLLEAGLARADAFLALSA
ncbi:MAG: Trk system potassium transporter TrkA, partial [Clostridia bacterium]|nr:Trk system potassium transporter TrkA [Clostridia bacterium]